MLITSLDNDRIKGYIKLKDRKYRKKTNTFIVEGRHLVLEAYKAGKIIELILEKDEVLPLDLPIVYVTNEIISRISEMDTPSTVMALCRMDDEKEVTGDKILMLDGIQDPGNLGTIIRSALAFNVDTIVMSPECVDLYNPKVIRSTQGMLFNINIKRTNIKETIEKLKEKDYLILGTKVNGGINVKDYSVNKKFALIIGNEGQGISKDILDLCEDYLYINMVSKCESLNAGVAASILMYELGGKNEIHKDW